jgi:hypothetical protein
VHVDPAILALEHAVGPVPTPLNASANKRVQSQALFLAVHTAAVKATTPALVEVEVAVPVVQVADPAVVAMKLAAHPRVHEVPGDTAPTIADEVHDPTAVFDPAPIVALAAAISQTLLLRVHVPEVTRQVPAVTGPGLGAVPLVQVDTYESDPVAEAVLTHAGVHVVVEPV